MEEKIFIDYTNIDNYTRDPAEYRFVDKAEVIPGQSAIGTKLCSGQDWYFKIHFPNDPIMPGVFVMEGIMTTGSFALTTLWGGETRILFNGAKSVKFHSGVRPGDVLLLEAAIKSIHYGVIEFTGKASVEGRLVCTLEFTLVAPDKMIGRK